MIEELTDKEIYDLIANWSDEHNIKTLNHETKVDLVALRSKLVKQPEKTFNDNIVVEYINYVMRFDILDINKFIKALKEDNLQKV